MFGFLWDLHQQDRINETSQRISDLRASARDDSANFQHLQTRLDALVLANLAMWTIMREKLGVTDAELERMVQAIDLSDGHMDGRVRVGPWSCPACKRPNAPKHARCLYCGVERASGNVFPV
jgi:hypothetical protein